MDSGIITLQGFDQLARALDRLPEEIAKKFLKDGLVQAAQVIVSAAEANLHLPGPSVGTQVKRTGALNAPQVWIGILKNRWYLLFKEYPGGTRAYEITAKNKKVLAEATDIAAGLSEYHQAGLWKRFKGTIFGTKAHIPPRPAKPFLRPAFDSEKERAVSAMGTYLGPRIEEEAHKLVLGG